MPSFSRDTLLKAINRGDLSAVRGFVERGDIPARRTYEWSNPDTHPLFQPEDGVGANASLLTTACKVGHVEVVRYLLEAGDYREHYAQYAPEAFAAMEYGHLEVFRLLCEYGLDADVQEFSKHGESITALAIDERRIEYLRLLLPWEPSIFVDYEDEETTDEEFESGKLPSTLELAARAGDVELAELLLEAEFPLGEQSTDYYLEKAQQNAPKYQQRLKQQAREEQEEKERRKQQQEEDAKNAESANFWSCIFFILFAIAFVWLFWRLVLWGGWLGGVALLLICGLGVVRWFKSL
ncbi:hypothetical protein IAD21_02604 [Abditibacteriota bacterium]|nr:hypothetical protein IAD21_02604 [Abditibacteriota bacterium]